MNTLVVEMDMAVRIIDDDVWTVTLPHAFLDHLLTKGHAFADVLILQVDTPYGDRQYCSLREFGTERTPVSASDVMLVPANLNARWNLVDDMYVYVDVAAVPPKPHQIVIRGHCDDFGLINDIREALEALFCDMRVLTVGTYVLKQGSVEYPFDVLHILAADGSELLVGLVQECDVEIDFRPTLETIAREEREAAERLIKEQERQLAERAEAERLALERAGYHGTGVRLGGSAPQDREAARKARLERYGQK